MMKILLAVMFWIALVQSSMAAEHWETAPEASTASLAANSAKLEASSGLSFPDGRQAIVTFWTSSSGPVFQCVTFYDASMQATGEKCLFAQK